VASRDGRTLAWASGFWRGAAVHDPARVFVSAADGSGVRPVSVPGSGLYFPEALAPDGSQVLISRHDTDSSILASTRLDERRAITDAERREIRRQWRTPEWSPDGHYRVQTWWSDAPGGRLLIVPADGGPAREIAIPGTVENHYAAWSPDGRWIALVAVAEFASEPDIWVIRPDGSGLRRLTEGANAWDPRWSPDGSLIAYSTDDHDVHGGVAIRLMRPNGSGHRKLAGGLDGSDRRSAYSASWIDARTLVFVSSQYRNGPNKVVDIHTIRSDGHGERRITYECHLGTRGADKISGSLLADTIRAFAGNDEIAAGPGADDVDAGPGADSIRTVDRARDTVRCGPGRDEVEADRRPHRPRLRARQEEVGPGLR
jgi:hypothetical protein